MKILFYSSYYYPYTSGITTYPFALFSTLVEENLVTVLTFAHQPKLKPFEVVNSMHIHRMPYTFKVSKGYISIQSLFYFFNEARKNDVVILNIPNFEGLMLAVFAKLFRKKLISIFHCQVDLGSNWINRIIAFFLNMSVGMQLWMSDTIVAYTKEYVERVGVWDKYKKKIVTVLPPVPLPTVDEKKLAEFMKEKKQSTWIGYAGRVSREKGIEYLVKAAIQLIDAKKKVTLVFAGPYGKDVAGEQEYYQKIMRMLAKHKIPHMFLGNLSGGILGAFYKAIDILVLPSTNRTEAFGMVQAEAMMMGTPVICTNLPGVRVPITLTGMGEVVKPNNAAQIAETIQKILKKKSAYTNDTLVKKARQLFDIAPVFEVYKKLLKKK